MYVEKMEVEQECSSNGENDGCGQNISKMPKQTDVKNEKRGMLLRSNQDTP